MSNKATSSSITIPDTTYSPLTGNQIVPFSACIALKAWLNLLLLYHSLEDKKVVTDQLYLRISETRHVQNWEV